MRAAVDDLDAQIAAAGAGTPTMSTMKQNSTATDPRSSRS